MLKLEWFKSYGRDSVDGSPSSACDTCYRSIRRGAWELIATIADGPFEGDSVGTWCRRHGWPRWQQAGEVVDSFGYARSYRLLSEV